MRDATSLGSAKQLLRALHVVEFIEDMIDSGKSSTLREMYYISEGWGYGKFGSQNDSNNLAEDLEVITKCMREDFKLRPEEDGSRIIGNLTINELNRRGEWMRLMQGTMLEIQAMCIQCGVRKLELLEMILIS